MQEMVVVKDKNAHLFLYNFFKRQYSITIHLIWFLKSTNFPCDQILEYSNFTNFMIKYVLTCTVSLHIVSVVHVDLHALSGSLKYGPLQN